MVLFGLPLTADRLAPLVPDAFERRLGDVADSQVKTMFGAKVCDNAAGQKAFVKLVTAIRRSAGLDTSVQSGVLSSPIPNAFALPGGKVYLFDGLLAKAENADEIAGVLAHELGHLKHRDSMRGADLRRRHVVPDRTAVRRHHRLQRADLRLAHAGDVVAFARGRDTMPTVLRSTSCTGSAGRRSRPGNCCFGSPAKEGKGLSIISTHPLSEDRLARMSREDRPASGPPLLTAEEWRSLKSICDGKSLDPANTVLTRPKSEPIRLSPALFRDLAGSIGAGAALPGFSSHTACMAEKACEITGS